MISAEVGYECVDWGGVTHVGGGSHGGLNRGDSLAPLIFCGTDRNVPSAGSSGRSATRRGSSSSTLESGRRSRPCEDAEDDVSPIETARRIGRGTRNPDNWTQLVKFGLVGGSGYVVNLCVFAVLTRACRRPLHPGRGRRFLCRGHQQLPLEPGLDLRRDRRPRRLPGSALLCRLGGGARSQPGGAAVAGRRGYGRGAGAGTCRRDRDAVQLRRQQVMDLCVGLLGLPQQPACC